MKVPILRPVAALLLATAAPSPGSDGPSARDYPSIQEAIRANPGRVVEVPAGDYPISEPIRIDSDGSGLSGPGRIIQSDPDRAIIRVEGASGVRLVGLTLTRPPGRMDTLHEGVRADRCRDLVLQDLRVVDNRTRSGAIELHDCDAAQVRDCLVRNYQRVSVDDRTDSPDHGYAFKCLIGTGIVVQGGRGALIRGNRVIEAEMVATRDLKARSDLGRYVKKNPERGRLAGKKDWDAGVTDNWHQGTAILVSSPESTDFVQVTGNYVENAGQGFDLHADHVILSQNVVNDALIGMKAMHGSRHVLVLGNQFSRNSLWAIGLTAGAASRAARPAVDGKPAAPANVDGGSVVANNIISDFGYGQTRWIWGDGDDGSPIRFDNGQKPEEPPLSDVIVQGNIVYDTGRDGVLVDGRPATPAPRYRYAVRVDQGPGAARGLHFSNNLLHPGRQGVSNVPLAP